MVCFVTVLISLVEKAQGLDLVVSLVARISSVVGALFCSIVF